MAHSGQLMTADSFAEEADGAVAETSNVVSSLAPLVHEAIRLAQARPDSSQDDVSGARTVKSPGVQPSTLSFPYQYGAGFPVAPVPPRTAPRPSFHALQEWEGYVLEIRDGEFVARLVDLTAGSSHEDEEATIPLAEISDEDAATLREGGIFRWVIGYQRDPSGAKKRAYRRSCSAIFLGSPNAIFNKPGSGHARRYRRSRYKISIGDVRRATPKER